MLTTRGMGGQVQALPTAGYGPYLLDLDDGGSGGKQHYDIAPRRIYTSKKKTPPSLTIKGMIQEQEARTRAQQDVPASERAILEIAGEEYGLWEGKAPSPREALQQLPKVQLEARITAAQSELGISRKQAKKALETRAEKELQATEAFKGTLVRDDAEFLIILAAADA